MTNPLDLSGKHFLVTGASSGIGRETAILISRLGGKLTLTGRNIDRLNETLHALEGAAHRAEACDISVVAGIPAWLKSLAAGAPLHGLVHCAGIHRLTPLRVLSPEALDEIMRVNVYSAAMLARGFRQKTCVAPGGGSIVLISSVAGLAGEPGASAYCASKAALLGLTRSLAMELAGENIRVNAVAPGLVKGEMSDRLLASLTPEQATAVIGKHPLGAGATLDVAHAIVFLLADTGKWITGSTLAVDGGYTAQ